MKTKEVTLDNIEKEDILQMARYIQELEQMNKDQAGYILQLQQQLTNLGKRISDARRAQSVGTITTEIVEAATLELPTLKKG